MEIPASLFRQVFESLPSPLLLLEANEEYTLSAYNRAAVSLLGTMADKAIDKPFVPYFDEHGKNHLRDALNMVVQSGTEKRLTGQRFSSMSQDGCQTLSCKSWNIVITPLSDESGLVTWVMLTIEEMSENFSAEKGSLIHQLRQPLAIISALASQLRLQEMLKESGDSELSDSLMSIEKHCRDLSDRMKMLQKH